MTTNNVQFDNSRIDGPFEYPCPVDRESRPVGLSTRWAFSCAVLTPESITNYLNAEIAAEKAEGDR